MSTNQEGRGVEIVVSTRFQLLPPIDDRDPAELLTAEEGVALQLEDGRRIQLDPGDARSPGFIRVVDGLARQGRPVAFELDLEDRIVRLFTPHVSQVISLREIDRGVLSVDLAASHGRHTLRDSHPDYAALTETLGRAIESGATVILTEDDSHDVLDVQVIDEGGPPLVLRDRPRKSFLARIADIYRSFIHWITCWCSFPWGLFRAVSPSKAQQMFDDLAARSCDPLTVPAPCIPFLYPDDGCWGRAHEMCRLIVEERMKPCKVWIEGSLHVNTVNNPNCEVWWGWHVAPTHCVRGSGLFGFFKIRSMVFDPALFTTPVTKTQWKGVQGDPTATLTNSSWTIFYLWGTSTNNTWSTLTDPSYTQTNSVLAYYRISLQNRAVQFGPPPYSCP